MEGTTQALEVSKVCTSSPEMVKMSTFVLAYMQLMRRVFPTARAGLYGSGQTCTSQVGVEVLVGVFEQVEVLVLVGVLVGLLVGVIVGVFVGVLVDVIVKLLVG